MTMHSKPWSGFDGLRLPLPIILSGVRRRSCGERRRSSTSGRSFMVREGEWDRSLHVFACLHQRQHHFLHPCNAFVTLLLIGASRVFRIILASNMGAAQRFLRDRVSCSTWPSIRHAWRRQPSPNDESGSYLALTFEPCAQFLWSGAIYQVSLQVRRGYALLLCTLTQRRVMPWAQTCNAPCTCTSWHSDMRPPQRLQIVNNQSGDATRPGC